MGTSDRECKDSNIKDEKDLSSSRKKFEGRTEKLSKSEEISLGMKNLAK